MLWTGQRTPCSPLGSLPDCPFPSLLLLYTKHLQICSPWALSSRELELEKRWEQRMRHLKLSMHRRGLGRMDEVPWRRESIHPGLWDTHLAGHGHPHSDTGVLENGPVTRLLLPSFSLPFLPPLLSPLLPPPPFPPPLPFFFF